MSTNVVVIGGGLAGLVAANVVADASAGVTVLDRRSSVGGRARTEERDGYLLNQEPHALYVGGTAARILDHLEIPLNGSPPGQRRTLAVSDGRIDPLPDGLGSLLARACSRGAPSATSDLGSPDSTSSPQAATSTRRHGSSGSCTSHALVRLRRQRCESQLTSAIWHD